MERNGPPQEASTAVAAPRAGAPSGRPASPVLQEQVRDLREERGTAQDLLNQLKAQNQHLLSDNLRLRIRVDLLQNLLRAMEQRENYLSTAVTSLDSQLKESCSWSVDLMMGNSKVWEEKRQLRQRLWEARVREKTLLENLGKAEIQLRQVLEQLRVQLPQVATLEEAERSQRSNMDQQVEQIRVLEMVQRRLRYDAQELKGNIHVFCRVRPVLPEELKRQQGLEHLHFPPQDSRKLVLITPSMSHGWQRQRLDSHYKFSFNRVFPPGSSQQEIFEEIQELVQCALKSRPVCIFAYGQTGSGKTFTMEGPEPLGAPESHGIILRAVQHLFQRAHDQERKGWKYYFSVSFLEIYNDSVRDLLSREQDSPDPESVQVDPDRCDLRDFTWVAVENEEQVLELLQRARSQRLVAETGLNNRSSRSHSVFQMFMNGYQDDDEMDWPSYLTVVDLAGSKRRNKSKLVGNRLQEIESINSSLEALRRVIIALYNKEKDIPYSNSRLTFLLRNRLNSKAKVLMFVTISPLEENFRASLHCLQFANKLSEWPLDIPRPDSD